MTACRPNSLNCDEALRYAREIIEREVAHAVRRWVDRLEGARPDVLRVGYFGSCARGDWGPGDDLDILIIVQASDERFDRRAAGLDATELPVPADVLVHTKDEGMPSAGAGSSTRG